jgi:two-component system, NtrC family, sensor kinase
MLPKSLKFKVSLYLTIALVGVMFLFILLIIQQQREELLAAVIEHETQLSQVIARSTRYAMLLDEPDIVDNIILNPAITRSQRG